MNRQNYIAATQNVALVNHNRAWIEVRGVDAKKFLNGRLTNNIAELQDRGCYTLLLTPKGKYIADLFCYPCSDYFGLDCEASLKEKVLEELKKYIIFQKVEIVDPTENWEAFSLIGPQAKDFINPMVSKLPQKEWEDLSTELSGISIHIILKKLWGLAAYEIWTKRGEAETLKKKWDLPVVDSQTQEILRIESATPLWKIEINENTIPLEANLHSAISFTKGCYVGQEIIARIHYRGHVGKQLVQIKIESEELPKSGEKIFSQNGEEIGFVTSSCFSPKFGVFVALGYLKYSCLNSPTIKVGSHHATRVL